MENAILTRTELLTRFKQLTDQGLLSEARSLLNRFQPQDRVDRRIVGHFSAQLFMFAQDYASARDLLIETRDEFGPHLRLLNDLASCHYFLEEHQRWKESVEAFVDEFTKNGFQVNRDTYFRCALRVAKIREEEGALGIALDLYEKLLDEFTERDESERHLRTLCQVLRVLAMTGKRKGLGRYYRELVHVSPATVSKALYIEFQHALILAEMTLIGVETAKSRLLETMNNAAVLDRDRSFLWFEYLEAGLARGIAVARLREGLPDSIRYKGQDTLETELEQILAGCADRDVKRIALLQERIPAASFLRIVSLALISSRSDKETDEDIELRHLFLLFVDSLDARSQDLWLSRLNALTASAKKYSLFLDRQRQEVRSGERCVSLSRNPTYWRILLALVEQRELAIDLFIANYCHEKFDRTHAERTRMAASRLNKLLLEIVPVAKVVMVTKASLKMNPAVFLYESQNEKRST